MADKLEDRTESKEQISSKLKKELANRFLEISEENIPQDKLFKNLGMDSLDEFEFADYVEKKYKVFIKNEDIENKLKTVDDYTEFIHSYKP